MHAFVLTVFILNCLGLICDLLKFIAGSNAKPNLTVITIQTAFTIWAASLLWT